MPSDVEEAAQVLVQAFVDDPLFSFMFPSKATRVKSTATFFRVYSDISIKNRRGYGVGEPLQGVAYWKFPDQKPISIRMQSLVKLLPLFFSMYLIGHLNARRISHQMRFMHKKYANEPHFYLDYLGVLASARGKGLSSKLIRPFLKIADSQKVITYTETVTPLNVPLYAHFGFQCVEKHPVVGTGITIYALHRPLQQT